MAIDDLKTRTPVVAAVDEWNRIGASAFRSKHGAGAARRYFLVVGNTRYDLKPVMAAAHNLAFPKKQPLRSRAFHTHVARSVAEGLGFDVLSRRLPPMSKPNVSGFRNRRLLTSIPNRPLMVALGRSLTSSNAKARLSLGRRFWRRTIAVALSQAATWSRSSMPRTSCRTEVPRQIT